MAAPKTKTANERLEQQRKMWNMWTSGMSKYRIAKIIGCHETNVGSIINRLERKLNEQKNG